MCTWDTDSTMNNERQDRGVCVELKGSGTELWAIILLIMDKSEAVYLYILRHLHGATQEKCDCTDC